MTMFKIHRLTGPAASVSSENSDEVVNHAVDGALASGAGDLVLIDDPAVGGRAVVTRDVVLNGTAVWEMLVRKRGCGLK